MVKKIAFAVLFLIVFGFLSGVSYAAPITIGQTLIGPTADSNQDMLLAQAANLSQTATIYNMSFYVTTPAGNLILGVYDSTGPGGGPGAKVAGTNSFTPVTGWNTVPVITPVLLPAGTYWLAHLPNNAGMAYRLNNSGSCRYYAYTFGPLPANFSTSPTSGVCHWSFYATLETTSELVVALGFNEGSGMVTTDSSGNGNNGMLNTGVTWTTGKYGNALNFSGGANNWVTVNDSDSLDVTGGITMEAWFYITDAGTWKTILMKEPSPEYSLFAAGSSGTPSQTLYLEGTYRELAAGLPYLNNWTHVAATWNGTRQRLYVNGADVGNRTQNGTMLTSANPLRIGGNQVWGEYLNGKIDEIRIYNRPLTQAEIQTDMSTPINAPLGPVAAYGFDENVGTTVIDFSGNGNNGTFANSAWTSGQYGSAPWLAATTRYITIPNSSSLNIAGKNLTIEFWNMNTVCSGITQVAVDKPWTAGVYGVPPYQYGVEYNPTLGMYQFSFGNSGGVQVGPFNMTASCGGWLHVAFTYNGTNVIGYLNGVQQFSTPETSSLVARGNALLLGVSPNYNYPIGGAIDEFRIYNRSLTQAEIQTDMSTSITSIDTTPPTVLLTFPTNGSAVSRLINISANASDNFAVVAVQFKWDGVNYGSPDTQAPWLAINFNTSPYANGLHNVSAVATDASGKTANSSVVKVYVNNTDTTPPSQVTGLTATAVSSSQINLSWSAATDNVGVVGYYVYRNGTLLTAIGATYYSNTGLTANTTYRYTVAAYDAMINIGPQSANASATTLPAPDTTPPTVSMTAPANGSTILGVVNVNANASDNVGVVGVQFKLDGANLGAEDTVAPYSVSWNTSTASNGLHTLGAVARDAAGNTANAANVFVTVNNTVPDTTPPSQVTGLTATAVSSSQINLSWSAATDNVAVTGYYVYRNNVQIATTPNLTYPSAGLGANTTYNYTVAAYDAAGNVGPRSLNSSATTLPAPDTTPPVRSNGNPSLIVIYTNQTYMNLTTDEIATCKYSNMSAVPYSSMPYTFTTTGGTFHNVLLTALAPATYYYSFRCNDTSGNVNTNDYTITFNVSTVDTTPPSQVTGLTATAVSSSQINLSWSAATDNVAVTGYYVYRNNVQIATTPNLTYPSAGLGANTTYNYTVAAYDAAGNVGPRSLNSSATTFPPPDVTPPSQATGLTATPISYSWIDLTWNAATDNVGVTGYRIYRCTGSGCTPTANIANTTALSYANTGLSPSTTYVYTVAAYDAAGNVGPPSLNSSATTPAGVDTTPPQLIGINANTVTWSSSNIAWWTDESANSTVRYGLAPASLTLGASSPAMTTYRSIPLSGLSASTGYYYSLTSCDGSMNCATSSVYNFTTSGSPQCSDGTPPSTCSTNRPFYCSANYTLVNFCTSCGCGFNQTCNATGAGNCYVSTIPSYSNINLTGRIMRTNFNTFCAGCVLTITILGQTMVTVTNPAGYFNHVQQLAVAQGYYPATIALNDGSNSYTFTRVVKVV